MELHMERKHTLLENWKFAAGEDAGCLENGREIHGPHTGDAERDAGERQGAGWYEYNLYAPDEWKDQRVILHFHRICRGAAVYVNGTETAVLEDRGGMPADVELTDNLKPGEDNRIWVKVPEKVNEGYKEITGDAELWVTGRHYVKELRITTEPESDAAGKAAEPVSETAGEPGKPLSGMTGERPEKGAAQLRMEIIADGEKTRRLTAGWKLLRERNIPAAKPEASSQTGAKPEAGSQAGAKPEASSQTGAKPEAGSQTGAKPEAGSQAGTQPAVSPYVSPIVPGLRQYAGAMLCSDNQAVVESLLEEVDYWYPDRPTFYTVTIRLRSGTAVEDEVSCTFGFDGPSGRG